MKYIFFSILPLLIFHVAFSQSQKAYQDLENFYNEENYEACLKLVGEIEKVTKNQKDTLAANAFSYLGDAHFQMGNPEKAIKWFEREKQLRTELGLSATEGYSISLYNLANSYLQAGRYQQAGLIANELIVNDRVLFGVRSEDYISSVTSAVDIFIQLDKFNDAAKLLETTIRQQEKNSINQGILLNKLGDLFTLTSQFSKASRTLNSALDILIPKTGDRSKESINTTVNLGILYMEQGKFPEAEEVFEKVLETMEPEDMAYASTLNNQALVFQSLGQLQKAESTFKKIQILDSVSVGTTHPDYAVSLSNLGLVYTDEGKYTLAEKALTQALEIQRKNNESKSVSYARKINNLARVYQFSGKPDKAIAYNKEALEIFKKALGENTPEYATSSFNLGMAYWKSGKSEIGVKYLKSSASIRAAKLTKKHPKYAESMQKIAEYYWEQKKNKEARSHFNEVFANYYFQIDATFPVLTEEEKAKFYYTNIKPSFEKFNAFALEIKNEDPKILVDVYNHHINTKGSIMYATEKVKDAIQTAKDSSLTKDFELWQAQKEQIAKLYSQNHTPSVLDSLQQSADLLEKELARKSLVFQNQMIRRKVDWQDIQKGLKEGEAAIETIRFKSYSPVNGGTFKDEVIYGFLIVTKQTIDFPILVLLNNGNEMEHKFLNYYRNTIKFTLDDTKSFENYFEVLFESLEKHKVNKLYFSPDGVYNQINLNTIKNTSGKFILDLYDIRIVTNTKEIIDQKKSKVNGQSSILIGFPKFNLDRESEVAKQQTRSIIRGGNVSRSLRGGLLRYMRGEGGISTLPGTQIEIQKISQLAPDPKIYTEAKAEEGLVKSVSSPSILHIATHGYFLAEDEVASGDLGNQINYFPNPLLKSGIILAGAENFLRTGTPVNDQGDDGILTAYEAMNLKLEDTDLVVLSACETGLGEIKNGEGVYGLQRAFKLAGARNIIMSLWSVDDAATQELMTSFYSERLKTNDTQLAFRKAQQNLKEKFSHPFYWGAFIMIGL